MYVDVMKTSSMSGCDSVVMLTWSDWRSEPRSNRYHYATRLAREKIVYFVQPDGERNTVTFEQSGFKNIILVHIDPNYTVESFEMLARALYARNVRNPLVWIYNVFLWDVAVMLNSRLTVLHATEDYYSPSDESLSFGEAIRKVNIDRIAKNDLIISVSQGVSKSIRENTRYRGRILTLPNGCDFSFWKETGASEYVAPDGFGNVALFQGGINGRLDYGLLDTLVRLLPHWQFWFCGKLGDTGGAWEQLKQEPNVRDFGLLDSEGIADLARQSRVGIIPFKQDGLMRRSLPLKAYEYLACGLPVVTIPIDALQAHPDLFTTAETAEAFAEAIEKLGPTRTDPDFIARRLDAARAASYDARFAELLETIAEEMEKKRRLKPRLNILMLYDDRSTHVGTILEHLEAFQKYSRHQFHFLPATGHHALADKEKRHLDFSPYDAVAIHYSVRVSIEDHLSAGIADAVKAYCGPKLLFIQDEYDRTHLARKWIADLGIDAIFTNVPEESWDFVYPQDENTRFDLIPTLTGYVPEDPAIDSYALPIAERTTLIGYRGRILPHQYGELGNEKYRIGVDVRAHAERSGLPVDIEVDDTKRIYGTDWYRFIGSVRATLGTESGCNVFDFDGELSRLAREHARMPFQDFAARYLKEHEGLVRMNQISPKIFEAIRLRTALVLFEGSYSGVVRPGDHFIPLKKDYSNLDEVFAKLHDVKYLEALTERAYRDIIESGRYSYRTFVESVDDYLNERAGGRRRATILSMPAFAIYPGGTSVAITDGLPEGVLLGSTVLTPSLTRENVLQLADGYVRDRGALGRVLVTPAVERGRAYRIARKLWRTLPFGLRIQIATTARAAIRGRGPEQEKGLLQRMARTAWRLLPTSLRRAIASRIR